MDRKRISVIGGSGFIGTVLVRDLVRAGHDVCIGDIVESEAYPELWRHVDVRDLAGLRSCLDGQDVVYNLAAEHRDDVRPASLYYDVNVKGAQNVCTAASECRIGQIIFTSTVAVYGSTRNEATESDPLRPFNAYGWSKLEAENVYVDWARQRPSRSAIIVRPTVVFGEGNRGNVYNLIRQIAENRFVMVGSGTNRKSLAYVDNTAAFLEFVMGLDEGIHVFNYADKPDFDMNELVKLIRDELGQSDAIPLRLPYALGYVVGLGFDATARILGRPLPVSSVRVRKFATNSQFSAVKVRDTGFVPPVPVIEGLRRTIVSEFLSDRAPAE